MAWGQVCPLILTQAKVICSTGSETGLSIDLAVTTRLLRPCPGVRFLLCTLCGLNTGSVTQKQLILLTKCTVHLDEQVTSGLGDVEDSGVAGWTGVQREARPLDTRGEDLPLELWVCRSEENPYRSSRCTGRARERALRVRDGGQRPGRALGGRQRALLMKQGQGSSIWPL